MRREIDKLSFEERKEVEREKEVLKRMKVLV